MFDPLGMRREIALMRTQRGPINCVGCNLILHQPRVRCPRCKEPYRVGQCPICQDGPHIVTASTMDIDSSFNERQVICIRCAWAGENAFRDAAFWSAPLGLAHHVGWVLVALCFIEIASLGILRIAPSSWPAPMACALAVFSEQDLNKGNKFGRQATQHRRRDIGHRLANDCGPDPSSAAR